MAGEIFRITFELVSDPSEATSFETLSGSTKWAEIASAFSGLPLSVWPEFHGYVVSYAVNRNAKTFLKVWDV